MPNEWEESPPHRWIAAGRSHPISSLPVGRIAWSASHRPRGLAAGTWARIVYK